MTRPIHQRMIAASAVLGLVVLASMTFARQGLVTTTDKQTFEGEVSETDDQVMIVRKGLTTTLPRAAVASIDYATYAERFAKSLAALASDDVAGRVTLGRQAFDQGNYDLAERALSSALDIDPLDRDARRFYAIVSRQLNLPTQREARRVATRPTTGPAARPAPPRIGAGHAAGLSEDQVNLVRQAELRRGDRVRIRFAENVRKRYVDSQPGMSFQQFSTLDDSDQAIAILTYGTPDQIDDVHLLSDPSAIQAFTTRINGPIVKGCATSFCHGGDQAGNFRLLAGIPDPATSITNFYLVSTYQKTATTVPGSRFGGALLSMVNRGNATESLLYQYALPRALATQKHPIVRGWDGLFRNADDHVARDLIDWMNLVLNPMTPVYGFDYKPVSKRPSTESTTTPAD